VTAQERLVGEMGGDLLGDGDIGHEHELCRPVFTVTD
jgi:hypothetical protein